MSKRLSETEKWRDPWFRNLRVSHKALWFWLLDNCDMAGVLKEIDWGLASFQIGEIVSEADMQVFSGRIEAIPQGWWIKKFCAFQYGWIDDQSSSNVHRAVIKALERASITLDRVNEGLAKPCPRPKDKDKDKDILSIYSEYPKKEAKQAGLRAIGAALDRGVTVEHLLERTRAYAAAVALWPASDKTFIPHPATWFNQGRYEDDPATWKRTNHANTGSGTPGSSRHFENANHAAYNAF